MRSKHGQVNGQASFDQAGHRPDEAREAFAEESPAIDGSTVVGWLVRHGLGRSQVGETSGQVRNSIPARAKQPRIAVEVGLFVGKLPLSGDGPSGTPDAL